MKLFALSAACIAVTACGPSDPPASYCGGTLQAHMKVVFDGEMETVAVEGALPEGYLPLEQIGLYPPFYVKCEDLDAPHFARSE